MIWSQFSTKVLQITILHINDWDNIQKKTYLWNRFYVCIIKCIWYQSKCLKKEGRRILNFSQEWQKDKSFQILGPAIHLEGWGKYFEHEYVIKLSKNLLESWKTNEWSQCSLRRSRLLSIESNTNAEFQSRVSLIYTNSDPT